jgi:hypothetical protein
MVRRLILAAVLLTVFCTAAEAVTIPRGRKGRKYLRHFSLVENLKSDKLAVYEEYGYTPHRLRIRFAGEVKERWRYHSLGLEFVFDRDQNLVEKRTFHPEPGSWRAGHVD